MLFVLAILYIAYGQNNCNTTISGSTITDDYNDFIIELSSNTTFTNDTFIRFSTCSSETTFDTVLYLLTKDKTKIVDACDDQCPSDIPVV